MRLRHFVPVVIIIACPLAWAEEDDRAPEPTPAQTAEAEKLVHDVYKDDFAKRAAEERRELAIKLLNEAKNTKSDTNSQYALLKQARDTAIQVGDVETALEATEVIGKSFKVDPNDMRLKALTMLRMNVKMDTAPMAADAAMSLINQAMAAENLDVAMKAADLATGFATTARNMQLIGDIQIKKGEIKAQTTAQLEMKIAQDKLRTSPGDPQAKYTIGSYLCIFRNDWDKGLPLLAEGSESSWAEASKADIANPVDVPGMVKVADYWWDLANKNTSVKQRVLTRAEFWYNLAVASADGLVKSKIEKRLEKIEQGKTGGAGGNYNVSQETRKALPTPAELARIRELLPKVRQGDSGRGQELNGMVQAIQTRLRADLYDQKPADFVARLRADNSLRRQIEKAAVPYYSFYGSISMHVTQYMGGAATKEDFAARAIALERSNSSDKLMDKSMFDTCVYNAMRSFASRHYTLFTTARARTEFSTYLKTKGVKSEGVDTYRNYYSRQRSTY